MATNKPEFIDVTIDAEALIERIGTLRARNAITEHEYRALFACVLIAQNVAGSAPVQWMDGGAALN
jgi:hypothetical protein